MGVDQFLSHRADGADPASGFPGDCGPSPFSTCGPRTSLHRAGLGARPWYSFCFGDLTPGDFVQERSVLACPEAFRVSRNKLGRGVQMSEVSKRRATWDSCAHLCTNSHQESDWKLWTL